MSANDFEDAHSDLATTVICEHKGFQVRWTITEFRDVKYFGIRKFYLDFDGEWQATRNGVTLPYTIDTATKLWEGFTEILSEAEVLDKVIESKNDGLMSDD